MSARNILVVTHPRSGTHFLINAICMNCYDAEFPLIRNMYASIEGLFLAHDKEFTREWEECIRRDDGKIRMFKAHFTPSEAKLAIDSDSYLGKREKAIVKEIYENSRIVHVYRDGRDALTSCYHFQKEAGGGLPQGGKFRLDKCTFSEFIRMPNNYYTTVRGHEKDKDENRCRYWSYYIDEWLERDDVIHLSYESLHSDFETTIKKIAGLLGIEERLADKIERPPIRQIAEANIFSRGLRKAKRTLMPVLSGDRYIDFSKIPPPSSPRKGIAGDWKNHFSDSDSEFFAGFAKDTMLKLNYKI